MSCECIQLNSFGQCDETISFELGESNANKLLIFNITGRSERIYQISGIESDDTGRSTIDASNLIPNYLSIHSKNKYKVWFYELNQENGNLESVTINEYGKSCFEFEVSQIIVSEILETP